MGCCVTYVHIFPHTLQWVWTVFYRTWHKPELLKEQAREPTRERISALLCSAWRGKEPALAIVYAAHTGLSSNTETLILVDSKYAVMLCSSGLIPTVLCNWTGVFGQGKGWRISPSSPKVRTRLRSGTGAVTEQLSCTRGFPHGHSLPTGRPLEFWHTTKKQNTSSVTAWLLQQSSGECCSRSSDYTDIDLKAMNFGGSCLKPLIWP